MYIYRDMEPRDAATSDALHSCFQEAYKYTHVDLRVCYRVAMLSAPNMYVHHVHRTRANDERCAGHQR